MKLGEEENIANKVFGNFIAIKRDFSKKGRNPFWLFQCKECGQIKSINKTKVIKGKINCICNSSKASLDLVGKVFGKLTVIEYSHTDDHYRTMWKVHCGYCNKIFITRGTSVKNGDIHSCGCLSSTYKRSGARATEEVGLKRLYYCYCRNAKSKNRFFDLTIEEFKEITKKNCFYCGSEPKTISKSPGKYACKDSVYLYNGIDRMDSNKGYEKDNIVPCCETCNKMKCLMTVKDFQDHVCKIFNFLNKDKINA